ncbi:hypothetical protein BXY41_10452 [Lacrimispora xylanisolvens]|uniref:Uncharacterized protein n=1 Tax=Lacrimispora xylanisolvens TaxID=384636 RepID=A0A2S6HTT0_9FIRM|nr:hypothetical protein [Hungatella xylanolytica]PPK81253.1 hypothetical protein BXY41_10452 [Hungatella xylanolytica]
MKKKRVLLFMLIFALGIPLTSFGKIEQGHRKWGSKTLQKDGTYKLFSSYIKEDGNMARNEWIESISEGGVGVSIFEYYGDDGNILSNTTTPDGYLVNYEGRWYKNCPKATINVAQEGRIEQYGSVFFPFSYDGEIVRNDYLGINLNYGDKEYQEGFELDMDNYTCAGSYTAFSIISPAKVAAKLSTFPFDKSSDEAISGWVDDKDYAKITGSNVIHKEILVGGKLLKGYQIISTYPNDQRIFYTTRLFSPIPGGASWGIEISFQNPEDEEQLLNWLNAHMTVSK